MVAFKGLNLNTTRCGSGALSRKTHVKFKIRKDIESHISYQYIREDTSITLPFTKKTIDEAVMNPPLKNTF